MSSPELPPGLDDRFIELERRLAEVEAQLDFLTRASIAPRPRPPAQPIAPPAPARSVSESVSPPPKDDEEVWSEQWLGQRGLLSVGVLLVLLAAGYLMKLSFERGWVSPSMRVASGIVGGLAAAGFGWRVMSRGLRKYGAALIGLGFGILYLTIWAASRLYTLVPPGWDIVSLTAVSLILAGIAYVVDIEALGIVAAAGAFFAPVLVSVGGNPNNYLIYLALVAATLGGASVARQWRRATFVVAAAYFGLGGGAATHAEGFHVLLFGVLGGSAALFVGLRQGWAEVRLLAFAGGWTLLGLAAARLHPWPVALGGVVLAAPLWWRGLTATTIWPDPAGRDEPGWSVGESIYFYLTPICLGTAIATLGSWLPHAAPPLVVGAAYLVPGLLRVRTPFALVGTSAVGYAACIQWTGPGAVCALAALALAWASLDHLLDRTDFRWYAALALAVAICLLAAALPDRGSTAAFTDPWAVALWLLSATAVVLAAGLWKTVGTDTPAERPANHSPALWDSWNAASQTWPAHGPAALWITAGLLIWLGVTGELTRYYGFSKLPSTTADLASGLSVSAWWALCAGALVGTGFVIRQRGPRMAGLVVASLAVGKVLLFDLSTLDALYRVASVFILGLVSLALAYLYHRYARSLAPDPARPVKGN